MSPTDPVPAARPASAPSASAPSASAIDRSRLRLLHQIEGMLERPMIVLGFVWLVLLVADLTAGLGPFLADLVVVIWGLFVAEFLLRLFLAPRKGRFLLVNWLTVLALALPFLRVFRLMRLVRGLGVLRGVQLVRVLGTLNRSIRAVRASLGRRRFGFVMATTLVMTVGGAAGLYALERGAGGPFTSYGQALWWSARLMMTIGPEAWPVTPEGRLLSLVLALYGFTLFGYVTATFASFFIGRDAANPRAEVAGAAQLAALEREIRALREALAAREAAAERRGEGERG